MDPDGLSKELRTGIAQFPLIPVFLHKPVEIRKVLIPPQHQCHHMLRNRRCIHARGIADPDTPFRTSRNIHVVKAGTRLDHHQTRSLIQNMVIHCKMLRDDHVGFL